jgi:hypothetical protein
MIIVANRATPKPPTPVPHENATEGQMPEPPPPQRQPTGPVTRPTLSLPHTLRGVPGARKA